MVKIKLQQSPSSSAKAKTCTEFFNGVVRVTLLSLIRNSVIACHLHETGGEHPDFENGEEYAVDISENPLRFTVTVEDPRVDGAEWTEDRMASEVRVACDGSVHVAYGEDGYMEKSADEFGETELFRLCACVESRAEKAGVPFRTGDD